MRLIRAREIGLMWDGDKICALVGSDLQEGVAGFGDSVPEALADPRAAKQFREGGVLKCACPECGLPTITELSTTIPEACQRKAPRRILEMRLSQSSFLP